MKTERLPKLIEPRSALLTVLCILTFIGSAWTFASSVWIYVTADRTAAMIEDAANPGSKNKSVLYKIGKAKRAVFGQKIFDKVLSMFDAEKIRYSALGNIMSSIFTLTGAILMWKLLRAGFFLYIFGVAISFLAPLLIYGLNFIGAGFSVSTGFSGLIFIALYTLEHKSLGVFQADPAHVGGMN
ncbi:hypothetical protein BH20BAC1_BH20BAC1_03160 [soil metagenome]